MRTATRPHDAEKRHHGSPQGFNTGKGESLTLGGTLVETPEGMEVDGVEINGWEEVKGDDVNADL